MNALGAVPTTAERHARPLVPALAVSGVVALALAAVLLRRLALAAAVRAAEPGALDAARSADRALLWASGVTGVLTLVTGVLWLRWFKALYAPVAAAGMARHSGDWWLWAWLIPVLNLWRPKQLVNDVWRVGDPPDGRAGPPWPVQVWWGLWVATTLLRFGGYWPGRRSQGAAGELIPVSPFDVVPAIVTALAAVFAIVTVRRLTERLAAFHEMAQPTLAGVLSRRPR